MHEMNSSGRAGGSEYLQQRDGVWIIDTRHAVERMQKRGKAMSQQQVRDFFDRVLQFHAAHKAEFEAMEYNSEVFFYSAKYRRGMILAHRKDGRGNVTGKQWILVTVYPHGASTPVQPETPKYII
jgi:hypothetical protein